MGLKTFEQKRANQPLRPDEVLFKKLSAPTRYEETDYYYAHKNLPSDQKLPSGDLLSALHAYISKLFDRTEEDGKEKTWKCMDETALIALGILMEEVAKEVMGETGDLALLEAARTDEERAFAGLPPEQPNSPQLGEILGKQLGEDDKAYLMRLIESERSGDRKEYAERMLQRLRKDEEAEYP